MFQKIMGIFILSLAFILVFALVIPSSQTVHTTIRFKTNHQLAFEQVHNLNNWKHWYPCEFKSTILSDSEIRWNNETKKNILTKIIHSKKNENINTLITLSNGHQLYGEWTFKEEEGDIRITWDMEVKHLSYPIGKIMGLFLEPSIKSYMNQGLQQIKKRTETPQQNDL